MQMLAIDLAKQSFHVHGVSADGQVVSKRVGRQGLPALIERLAARDGAGLSAALGEHIDTIVAEVSE